MKWPAQFSSSPPDTVWSFDAETAVLLRRDSKLGNRCSAREIPQETFVVGSAGLQAVDQEKLKPLLAELDHSIRASKRPAIVLPTAWMRVFLIEGDDLPKAGQELEDVIRWRLKKILPIPPGDLRLAFSEQGSHHGKRHVLCSVGIEKALHSLESAFASLGWKPGLIVPRVLALSLKIPDIPGRRLILQHERGFFSLALVEDESILFLRTKPLPHRGEKLETFTRELVMARSFIRESLDIDEELETLIVTEELELNKELGRRIADQEALRFSSFAWPEGCSDPVLSGALGRGHVEAMTSVLLGGRP